VTVHRTNPRAAEETAFPPDLLVTLDRSSGRSLREQLEEELRHAIRAGRLPVGTALPASRVLARELGVARGIVVDAYEQLAAEGYLEARQGSGTRVRGTRPARAVATGPNKSVRPRGTRACSAACPTRCASRARSGCAGTARRSRRCRTRRRAIPIRAGRSSCAPRSPPTSAACAPS